MNATSQATGRCECGGVSYRVDGPLRPVVDCHCAPCRRITGHFMAATEAASEAIHFENHETLRWYPRTDTVEYGFCGTCGSTLFWRATETPESLSIAAGTLDPPTGLVTTEAIFVAEASDYHRIDPSLATFDYEDR